MELLRVSILASATIWLWVCLTSSCLTTVSWAAACHLEMEKAALTEFFKLWPGSELPSFPGDLPRSECVCEWSGVACDEHGFIVSLDLYGTMDNASLATGPWPLPLSKLHSLQELRMFGFYHDGPLPQEIGLLSQSLTTLSLTTCQIRPPLPVAALANLSKLVHLELQSQSTSISSLNLGSSVLDFLGSSVLQQLCNVTTLQYIDLSWNGLHGGIPSCIGSLPHLSHLILFNNNLEGPIPDQIWSTSSNLTFLDLSYNFLSGQIYPGIANAEKMILLHLVGNSLEGNIPENVGKLSKLNSLRLGFNNLTGHIPASLGNLSKLGHLDLSNNMLSGDIPYQLGNLGNLGNIGNWSADDQSFSTGTTLDLSNNRLSGGIPVSLGQLGANTSLQIGVDLSSNNLTGELPWSLLTSSAIFELMLDSNHLTRFAAYGGASALVNTSSLRMLSVRMNDLTGPIPSWFDLLSGLHYLTLSDNNLEASSTSFPNSSLYEIDLGSNSIKGDIPSWLSQQTSLNYLDLSFNQLEGTIPGWLWSLNIGHIDLSMNRLGGDISLHGLCSLGGLFNASHNHFNRIQTANASQVCSRAALMELDLHSNQLSGLLPWNAASNLTDSLFWQSLNLADNSFFGGFPEFSSTEYSSSSMFDTPTFLDLSHNQLSGIIPASVSRLGLKSLRLSSNNFTGQIPSSLCVSVLRVESNSLSGSIPHELGLCDGLTSLVLRDNLLTGSIPDALNNRSTSLQVLDLSHNSLQGGIPPWIQHMQSLRVLIISHNGLSGRLPHKRWNTPQLQVMDLSSNNLSGEIPSQSLSNLMQGFLYNSLRKTKTDESGTLYDESFTIEAKGQVLEFTYLLMATVSLDLSSNVLTGPIPEELGSLNGLVFLKLSNNHLSGLIPDNFGGLRQLNSLDLSNNKLEGQIPGEALCFLTFLSFLDVSYNNLRGPIPQCNQWGTFTRHSFVGNKGLCGPQVEQQCTKSPISSPAAANHDQVMIDKGEDDNHDFLMALLVGFCIGFPSCLALSMLWRPISYPLDRLVGT